MSTHNSLPRVAIFIPSSAVGGAEHYIKNILYLIGEAGFQPTLVLPKNQEIVDFFVDLKANILIADIAWSGSADDLEISANYISKLSHQYKETNAILESLKPKIAFVNLPWVDFGLGISLACQSMKIPCTNLVHLCPWKVNLNELTRRLFQDLAESSSKFFTVSNENKIQLSLSTGIHLDRVKVLYNSRDIESGYISLTSRQYKFHRLELLDELELPLNSFLSLSIGRFSHQKNFLDIVTSFAKIHQELPNYYHIFLGEGELKQYYQKITEDLGLSCQIKFLGYRKDVSRFLALSDLFISTSLYEGLALSILEAAQFSCPIIAANSSSVKEIIPSSDYGFLYNSGQYYLLGEYIKFAYFNPKKIKKMALKLQKRCEQKFSLTQFKTNLKNTLQDSLNCELKQQTHISVSYDGELNTLVVKPNNNLNLDNYQYKIAKLASDKNNKSKISLQFFIKEYGDKILRENHDKYLHCLYKLSKKFLNTNIILCFNNFESSFFRNYYLKEKYLLLLLTCKTDSYVSFSVHYIDHTYWGQDLKPDCIGIFTTFDQVTSLANLQNINLQKTNYSHCYTSKHLLNSYFKLSSSNNFDNLSANFKLIDNLFKPASYHILEKDSRSAKVKLNPVTRLDAI